MTGGEALVATLLAHDVRAAFGVAGESYLAVLEALRKGRARLRFIPTRHESGAVFAAEAYAKLMRRPGIAFVTRGPGATNAAIGVHTAAQDSTPLVLFVGQVPTRRIGCEAFQEIDCRQMYGALAKAVITPERAEEVARSTARALELALSGRPGPVVVVLPEDLTMGDARAGPVPGPVERPVQRPPPALLAQASKLIGAARRPVLISGGLVSFEGAHAALKAFAEASGVAVATAWRRQDTFPADHPAYVGHLGIGRAPFQRTLFAECDLVIAAGARLDDITTEEGSLIRKDQRLIHVYPDAEVLRRQRATVAIEADVRPTLEALRSALREGPAQERIAWRASLNERARQFATPGADPKVAAHGPLDMARVVEAVARRLEGPQVIVNDAGNFAGWVQRYYPFREPWSQAAPTSGAMGYAVPAALGAKLARPDAEVVAFVGDGGFMMTGQELSTAVASGLAIRVILCDNQGLGTILMHQRRTFGTGAEFAVQHPSPDFVALAKAYGAAAFRVSATKEFAPAFEAALAHAGPALLHLVLDMRDISAFGPLGS